MRVGELCIREVIIAREDETVVEAARLMAERNVGDLVIVDSGFGGGLHPIGIVTDRDLVVQVLARPDRAARAITLGDIMRRDPITASEDDDVETVLGKLRSHGIRRIPIVNRDGGLEGIVSLDDVIGWMAEHMQSATKLLERQGRGAARLRA
jgi:CBS domain-containing protein